MLAKATLRSYSTVVFAVLALCITISSLFVPPGFSVLTYSSGLKTGDSAFYSLSGTFGFNPSRPVTQMKILDVVGTNITAGFDGFYPDGYVFPDFFSIDVFSGQTGNPASSLLFAVTPGLQLRDPVFNIPSSITIAGDETISCGGASRRVVSSQIVMSNRQIAIGWDELTGAMCRYRSSDLFQQSRTLDVAMTNTTLWRSGTNPDVSVLAEEISAVIGSPLLVVILFVYFRRRKRRK